ncbi:MAG TPA: thiamine phosphate synthase [Acidimicrobiales bacterium]|nr:thiamine phosphate synthase [Acidimicrobiales bacterium]
MPVGPLVVLTDRALAAAAGRSLPDTVHAAVRAGAPTVLYREKDLPAAYRRALGRDVADALVGTDARLIVASDPALAAELGAAGIHLSSRDPRPADHPGNVGALPFGRSCHSRAELADGAREGASWATLSPIHVTESKPGYGPALGPAALAGTPLPVLALGGVTAARAPACLAAGARGVAVMGAVMGSVDPAAVVQELLDALA